MFINALFVGVSLTLMTLLSSVPIARADDPADPLNALMMGGSLMPTPSEFWQDTIITDYIDPATGADYTPVLVATPESSASTSLQVGLADLQAAMAQQPANQSYLVEGFPRAPRSRSTRRSASCRPEPRRLTSPSCCSAPATDPMADSWSGSPVW